MKTLFLITSLLFLNSAFAENSMPGLIDQAIKMYEQSTVVKEKKALLETKGSQTNLCTYVNTGKIGITPLSIKNVPGDRFISLLITEEYTCNLMNADQADDLSNVYVFTTVVDVHQYPITGPQGSAILQTDYKINPNELAGKIDELEEGISL